MRALILAQGDGRRWQRPDGSLPLGLPKHLVAPDGAEPLLARTVRQLAERGVHDIVMVAPDDARYRSSGARLVTLDDPHPTGTSMDKMFATRQLWAADDRTTILWGDCWLSDAAADAIVGCDAQQPHWYRRPGPSSVTGHPWDESFALSFLPEHHDRLLACAQQVNHEVPPKKIHMFTLLAAWAGMRLPPAVAAVAELPQQTHIDDFTDDFDSWAEFCGWVGRYHAGSLDVDVAVCIPWYGAEPEPHRVRSAAWTRRWWESLDGLEVIYGAGRSRAEARNDAARRTDAEILFFADADTWVPAHQVWAAAWLAQHTGRFTPAYEGHVRMTAKTTGLVIDHGQSPDRVGSRSGREVLGASNGATAISRTLWDQVGGYDRRFIDWGGEDRAHQYACDTLAGRGERVAGRSWHFWHPAAPDTAPDHPGRVANETLALRYKAAAGFEPVAGVLRRTPGVTPDPDAIRRILREPGGPLHQGALDMSRPKPKAPKAAWAKHAASAHGVVDAATLSLAQLKKLCDCDAAPTPPPIEPPSIQPTAPPERPSAPGRRPAPTPALRGGANWSERVRAKQAERRRKAGLPEA